MRHYLLLGIGLALASCATQHQLTPARPPAAEATRPSEGPAYTPAMLTKQPDSPAVARRLFGLLPPKKVASSPKKVASDKLSDGKLPRKCKGCTIVYGDANIAGKKAQIAAGDGAAVVVAEKKAGPVVLADSGAQVQVATAGKGQAAAGKGISQQHEEVKPGPWPAIIGGVGIVGGIGLVYWLVAGGGALWLAGIFKRRKPEAQA